MWDLAEDPGSIRLIENTQAADKPLALVCHAPAALHRARTPDGRQLVEGRKVTGFTNTEEEAMGFTKATPFLVEDELTSQSGIFSKAADWQPYVVTDGLLIAGQNPASSGLAV